MTNTVSLRNLSTSGINAADIDTPCTDISESEATVSDFIALLKPRVMTLVLFTGFVGMWIAPGRTEIHPFLLLVAMLCLVIGAGAAGAINMWYDRDIDAIMDRTKNRPLPLGRITPDTALTFALMLLTGSITIMGLAVGWLAASILAFASFFYAVIYTIWLKRSTPQNIVIGGAAGAFPPVIGWAAVTADISFFPILLFAIIFFWTPPHFWALCLFANKDYKRANIPMMTVTAGEKHTKVLMLIYTVILLPITLAPYLLGYTGAIYGITAMILSGFFIFTAIRVYMSDDLKQARLMFGYSVFYLFALFLALLTG